jgi:hypothetical protein
MEVAAQMSQQARHLADVYSHEKVARAKSFLRQRQQEAEQHQERIVEAMHVCSEIRKWAQQVELEESVVASQLARLDAQLQSTLPALGYSLEHDAGEIIDEINIDDFDDDGDAFDMDGIDVAADPTPRDEKVVALAQKSAAE